MRQITRVVCIAVLAVAALLAQPVVNSVLNPASYALPGMPNYGVAQGGLFVAFGLRLGPTGFNQISAFPLPTTLNGISIRVTVGGTTVDCFVMNSYGSSPSLATQVVGLLPSNTPVGTGTLVLTYNGQASAAASIKVVAHSFGIVAVNSGGSGPAVVTDAGYQVRLITQSATASQILILWGTGLGAITGDESQPPVPRDMVELDVKVYVGGVLAEVLYRGRSGGAGLDQINFRVPPSMVGCYVPIVVVVNGIPSNWTTMPVAANNGACSDTDGMSSQEIDAARVRGNLRVGSINLSRTVGTFTVPGFGTLTSTTDNGNATFERYDSVGLISRRGFGGMGFLGDCVVFQFSGQTATAPDQAPPTYLDAGASLNVTGPRGAKQMPLTAQKGIYGATLGSNTTLVPGTLYLDAGAYAATAPGGADVAAFTANLTLPQNFVWTNQDAVNSVPRTQGLLVEWTGGAANGMVNIQGISMITTPSNYGAMFVCSAPAAAGRFIVPAVVLSALPASELIQGVPTGMLMLGTTTRPARFTATGLDFGTVSASTTAGKNVTFQ